jgi:hypothetical protein
MKHQAFNPYLPEGVYIPDGEPHVFDGRVYIYGSHDHCGSSRYCPGDYVVWSAPVDDLSDWSFRTIAYKRRNVRNRLGFRCLWAPDCTKGVDGKYYLYFCYDFDNRICVAQSSNPDGPFSFIGYVRHENGTLYGKGKEDIMCFDPAVFTDTDGKTYLYSGYSANDDLKKMLNRRGIKNVDGTGNQVVRLKNDMVTVEGSPKMLLPGYKNSAGTGFEGHEVYEASSLRKVGNKYYFIYSTRLSHELAYAVSDYPDRDFKYGGAIISNGDIGFQGKTTAEATNYWGNVHGSIEQINGNWYVFYHRQTNKNEQTRQGCAERIAIDETGKIQQVEMTSCGLNGNLLKGEGKYPAYIACHLTGKTGALKCKYGPFARHKYKLHPCVTEYIKGKQYIQGMREGAMAGFKYFNTTGQTVIMVTTRGSGGRFVIKTEQKGKKIGQILLNKSQIPIQSSAKIPLPKGKTALFFEYKGNGKVDFYDFALSAVPSGLAAEKQKI